MSPALHRLFLGAAVTAFDRQLYLADLVDGHDWHVDVPDSQLTFGDRYRWAVQFLGTESHADGAWLWAWANPSGLPRHGLFSVLALRDLGTRERIPEFVEAQLPLGNVDGHTLATVASGMRHANAYYQCPYEGGALFVLIQDLAYPRAEIDPVHRIATVFPQSLAVLPLADHRAAWIGYFGSDGLNSVAEGDALVTVRDGVAVLRATFDDQNRLTRLEANIAGEAGQL